MKSIFFALILFAVPAFSANIKLQAGESITLKPQQETTVTCTSASGAVIGSSKDPKSAKCSFSSDEACRDMDVGDLCNRDDKRGSCVPKKSIRGLECSCLLF